MKSVLMRFVVLAGWPFALLAHAQTPDCVAVRPHAIQPHRRGAERIQRVLQRAGVGRRAIPVAHRQRGRRTARTASPGLGEGERRAGGGGGGLLPERRADRAQSHAVAGQHARSAAGERAGRLHHAQRPRHAHSSGADPARAESAIDHRGAWDQTLSPSPTQAGALSISSANAAVATVPATVAFAAGQSTVQIPVTGVAGWHHHRDRQRQRRLGERRGERDARAADRHSARPRHACSRRA